MEIVIKRRILGISDDLFETAPDLAVALEDSMTSDNFLPGVWKDGRYYLWGSSRTNDAPEEICFVMTAKEYRLWKVNRLDISPRAMTKRLRLAQKLYPQLAIFI